MKSSDYLDIKTSKISPISDSLSAVVITDKDNSDKIVQVDSTNSRVGINVQPSYSLDVNGTMRISNTDNVESYLSLLAKNNNYYSSLYMGTVDLPSDAYIRYSNYSKAMDVRSNGASRMTIDSDGTINHKGFTKLGDDALAPSIKTKLLIFTSANVGSTASVIHGLKSEQIIGVSVLVKTTASVSIPPEYHTFGDTNNYSYNYVVYDNTIDIFTGSTGTEVANKSGTVLITYIAQQ